MTSVFSSLVPLYGLVLIADVCKQGNRACRDSFTTIAAVVAAAPFVILFPQVALGYMAL